MSDLSLALAGLAGLALLLRPRHGGRAYGHDGHWGDAGAGVLLTTGTHVFLLQRSEEVTEGGTWGTPGGKVDEGEDALTAALRELGEETHLALDLNQVKRLGQTVYHSPNGRFRYTTFVLRVPPATKKKPVHLNWENDASAWVTKAWLEENEEDLHPGLREVLKDLALLSFA